MTRTREDKIAELAALVGDDGTGDLGVIVDNADPIDTIHDLADLVCEARADASQERADKVRTMWIANRYNRMSY